jgi:hypothetical protein
MFASASPMKKILLLSVCVLVSASLCRANTVALWTFESPNIPPTLTGQTEGGLLPAIGTGDASASHASALTVYSSQVGNGSANAWNADLGRPEITGSSIPAPMAITKFI